MGEIKYLDKGLAVVLANLGLKTFGGYFGVEIPTLWNMAIVLSTIGFFIVLSLMSKGKIEKKVKDSPVRS